jgi:hypothetical protein
VRACTGVIRARKSSESLSGTRTALPIAGAFARRMNGLNFGQVSALL